MKNQSSILPRRTFWTNIQASLPEIIKRKVAHISRGNVKQLLNAVRVVCNGRRQKYVKFKQFCCLFPMFFAQNKGQNMSMISFL